MTELAVSKKDIFPPDDVEVSLDSSLGMFSFLTKAGEIIPPWWSRNRDIALRKTVIGNDNLSSAQYNFVSRLTATPVHIVPKDKSISSHVEQAALYERVLRYATESRSDRTRKGWNFGFGMFLTDLTGVDNGGVFVVEGPGDSDGPLTGMPTKLVHLDSVQVSRTKSSEYPIVYTDYDGKKYKIHHSRAIIISSMPSAAQSMYGVGLCAISRCIHVSQILLDQLVYKEEKLGSRPKERLIIGKKGITGEDIARAFYAADQSLNAQGLTRYSKTVVLAPNSRASSSEIDLDIQDLVDAGTIFDEQTSTTLGMYTVALAFGVPARWFWPATATGATKADATLSHIVGMQQGPGEILRSVKEALDMKFLPPHLEISFDYQDDAQDRDQAEIKKTRADQRKIDIEVSVITIRVAREQALDSGDITQAQFDAMELEDGRLPNGDSLLAAFSNRKDEQLREMLFLGVAEPLALSENDPFDMIIAIDDRALEIQGLTQNAPSAPMKRKARIAMHALGELKVLYEQEATDILAQEIKDEMEIMAQAQEGEPPQQEMPVEVSEEISEEAPEESVPEEETPLEEPMEEELPMEEKQFNFGARGGEVIGGGLARDLEGKFISKEELGSAIRQKLLDRLRQRKGLGEFGEDTNREAVAGELGSLLPAGGLDGLAVLGQGEPLEGDVANRLIDGGLARVDNTGQTRLTSAGASLLIAANKGNVERAKDALIRAQTQVGKGRAGGGGGGAEEETEEDREQEKEQEEADNRASIADKLKGTANETSKEQIDAMNNVRLGKEVSPETAQQLADKGMLEYDDTGVPFLSFDGRVFINAANQGELSLVRDVLARARAKHTRKIERVERLETNITENEEKIQELRDTIKTFEGARTIADITERAQLQNRLNELQDRVDKDADEVAVVRTRLGLGDTVEDVVEEEIVETKSFGNKLDEFLGIGKKDGEGNFQLSVRTEFRKVWTGIVTDPFDFVDGMVGVIRRGLTRAWYEGAKEHGLKPEDLTQKELDALEDTINGQFPFLPGLARDLIEMREQAIKDGRVPNLRNMPGNMFSRAELWVNRYGQTRILASTMAKLDAPRMWVLGDAEHCKSCARLEGKVKRASFWIESGILPQVPNASYLDCKGFRCACSLVDTKEPISKGRLPNLP